MRHSLKYCVFIYRSLRMRWYYEEAERNMQVKHLFVDALAFTDHSQTRPGITHFDLGVLGVLEEVLNEVFGGVSSKTIYVSKANLFLYRSFLKC